MRIDLCLKGARLDYADSLYLGPVGDTLVPLWKAEISSQNADELQAVVVDKGISLYSCFFLRVINLLYTSCSTESLIYFL